MELNPLLLSERASEELAATFKLPHTKRQKAYCCAPITGFCRIDGFTSLVIILIQGSLSFTCFLSVIFFLFFKCYLYLHISPLSLAHFVYDRSDVLEA